MNKREWIFYEKRENEFYILEESTSNLDFAIENIIFDMIYNKLRKKAMLMCLPEMLPDRHHLP